MKHISQLSQHGSILKQISQLSKHGSIWFAWTHTWHKLVNTLVFVDMKCNPMQASYKFNINKKTQASSNTLLATDLTNIM